LKRTAEQRLVSLCLNQLREGHVYYPYETLIEKCKEVLGVEREVVVQGISAIAFEGRVAIEDLNQDLGAFQANHKAVYLKHFHVSETGIAHHLARLFSALKRLRKIDAEKAVRWAQGKIRIQLAPKQIEAVETAVSEKMMVITGGPGTGKTTIINALMKIYREIGAKIFLAAPTGRASKRMSSVGRSWG
jgi:exodeoxyribonuclease V alpha subunit